MRQPYKLKRVQEMAVFYFVIFWHGDGGGIVLDTNRFNNKPLNN